MLSICASLHNLKTLAIKRKEKNKKQGLLTPCFNIGSMTEVSLA